MTRLIIAAALTSVCIFSESWAETEVILNRNKTLTIREVAPQQEQQPLKEPSDYEVNSLSRDEKRFIWESLSPSEQRAYRKSGTKSFKDLPMAEKKKLVGKWQQKKDTKVRLITPEEAERMNQQ